MNTTLEDKLTIIKLAEIIAQDTLGSFEELLEQLEPIDKSSKYNIARMNDEQFEAYVREVWKAGGGRKKRFTLDKVRAFVEEKRKEEIQKSPNGKYVLVHYDDFDRTTVVYGRYDNPETPIQIAKKELAKVPHYSKNLLFYYVYGLEGRIL